MWLQTKPKKVSGGWEYFIINQANKDDPDSRCFSTQKPDNNKIKKTLIRLNGGEDIPKARRYYKGSHPPTEAEEQIVKLLKKEPLTAPQVIDKLTVCASMIRRMLVRLSDKGALEKTIIRHQNGSKIARYSIRGWQYG